MVPGKLSYIESLLFIRNCAGHFLHTILFNSEFRLIFMLSEKMSLPSGRAGLELNQCHLTAVSA